jgi:hypothetical protein
VTSDNTDRALVKEAASRVYLSVGLARDAWRCEKEAQALRRLSPLDEAQRT